MAEKTLQQRLELEEKGREIQHLEEERQYYQDLERKEYLNDQISKLKYQQQLDEQFDHVTYEFPGTGALSLFLHHLTISQRFQVV